MCVNNLRELIVPLSWKPIVIISYLVKCLASGYAENRDREIKDCSTESSDVENPRFTEIDVKTQKIVPDLTLTNDGSKNKIQRLFLSLY